MKNKCIQRRLRLLNKVRAQAKNDLSLLMYFKMKNKFLLIILGAGMFSTRLSGQSTIDIAENSLKSVRPGREASSPGFEERRGNEFFLQADTMASKKIILGINTGSLISGGSGGLNFYAYFTLEKGKSLFAVGPVIGPEFKIALFGGSPVHGTYGLNGFHTIYQINPNNKAKRFDFFFQYDFFYLYHTYKGIETYPYNKGAYNSYQINIENYIGYGFKVKFFKNFYLNQSIGTGAIYTSYTLDYENFQGQTNRAFEPSLIIKIGLGYKFDYK